MLPSVGRNVLIMHSQMVLSFTLMLIIALELEHASLDVPPILLGLVIGRQV